jgi:DNA ligase-1
MKMFISPMLLQYAENNLPFDSESTRCELKFDGIRLLVSKMDRIRLYTRHNNECTSLFPELLDIDLPTGTILDGEVILTDDLGRPDFEELMKRYKSKRDKRMVTFVAFDIIKYKGIDVTGLPLHRRKELLEEAFDDSERYVKSRLVNGSSIEYFELVKINALEGIVIKDINSKYEVKKRSWSWLKVINWTYVDVFISGYRKNKFGWLTSVIDESGQLRPAGIIELGVTPLHKEDFYNIRQLIIGEDKNYVYMKPVTKAKIKTRNWTKKGMLRSPVLVELMIEK